MIQRSKLSQEVLQTLVAEDADIIAIQTQVIRQRSTKKHLENPWALPITKTPGALLRTETQ